ncbi:uncharacterized protein LOC134223002 [Armigeres subalbatus]|uniref:uncharacterized protein LOC134223002 n=1 Tax=Armigeres subalbatus TaxID=124917 RepID=UPI002ED3683B
MWILDPAVVKAKILLQTLWKLDYDWDHPLPKAFVNEWEDYQLHFNRLKTFRFPRHVQSLRRPAMVQIHGFSDASEHAYGACLYLRSITPDGFVTIRLLAAKSRVAPLNNKSIVRLELCAALLIARLLLSVCTSINVTENIHLWTDSTIVLHWLSANPSTWQTFVANRVAEIQELTTNCTWNHVPGDQNPADMISRGVNVDQLLDESLWWNGPAWLGTCSAAWPQPPEEFGRWKEKDLETRKCIALPITHSEVVDLITRFSSFTILLRIGTLCRRFANNCRRMANNRRHGPISVEELNTTLYGILRLVQAEYFGSELSALQGGRPIPPRSKLRYLCPAFQDGLIRVGGRLEHAAVVNDTRKPFVLPRKHPLTWLIATSIHRQQLHCGPQLLLSIIRQQFWPLGGRDLTREVVHKCVICVKTRPRNLVQLMGSLPAVRVTQSYTFENVGIDFAGPFYLQRPSPRSSPKKSYVAVFVCMATKASHLELVCELTTAAFIASLRRFIARRGRPQHIYCDNTTNFVEACLNSRTITPLSSDPNDLQALTPGHFLIGRALNDLPNPNYTVIPENRLRLWERVQRHTQQFWKRWHQEYLTTLQQRYKWSTVNRNLIVGVWS